MYSSTFPSHTHLPDKSTPPLCNAGQGECHNEAVRFSHKPKACKGWKSVQPLDLYGKLQWLPQTHSPGTPCTSGCL